VPQSQKITLEHLSTVEYSILRYYVEHFLNRDFDWKAELDKIVDRYTVETRIGVAGRLVDKGLLERSGGSRPTEAGIALFYPSGQKNQVIIE